MGFKEFRRGFEIKRLDVVEKDIIPFNNEILKSEWEQGGQEGEPCHVPLYSLDPSNPYSTKKVMHFSWKRGFQNVWTGWPNDGKAVDVETPIPTINGFVKMKDVGIGDVVYDESGNECMVTYISPIYTDRTCYRVKFNDGSFIDCCEDHLWLTYDSSELRSYYSLRNSRLKKRGSDQTSKRKTAKVRSTKQIFETQKGRGGRNNHAIPVCNSILGKYKSFEVDPYLLGAWLGDGTSSDGGFTSNDQEIIDEITSLGFDVSNYKSKYGYYIKGLKPMLRRVGVLNNKHIPIDYLFSSIDQRFSLLQGLMDTDGSISKSGVCEFTNCKKELAHNVYELVSSLGIKCSINEYPSMLNGRQVNVKWRVIFKTDLCVFRLKRKKDRLPKKIDRSQQFRFIVSVDKIDSIPVKCITVDSKSHLYLAGSNFIPTHNTQYCLFMMLVKSLHDGWKWVVWSPEMRSAQFVNGKVIINANDIINLLVWMMSGVTPYKHVAEKYGTPRLSIDEYFQLVEVVKSHFIFLDPENKTPKALNELLFSLYEKDGFDGVLIDPWKNVRQDIDKRSDIWLEEVFADTKDFAVKTNTSWNWIAHPKANVEKYRKGANGMTEIMPVTQEKLNGGAAWDNSMDGIYSIFRYNLHLNINSREVMFKNIKQRKQELVGERGDVDNIVFDAAKRRYIFSGTDPLQR